MKLVNATVTQNTAGQQGGGLFVAEKSEMSQVDNLIVNNSIVAINHAGDTAVNDNGTNDVMLFGANNKYTIAHSLIGIADALADATKTSTTYYYSGTAAAPLDPEFVKEFHWDTATGTWIDATDLLHNLQLKPTSVGINNGSNALALYENGTAIEFDLLDNPRIYTDPTNPNSIVDFGAYELQVSVLCDLAFYKEGKVNGDTTRTGTGTPGVWATPVILSTDAAADPMAPIATEIDSTDVVRVGVSFFNSDLATGTCTRAFPVTITCYRINSNGVETQYGEKIQMIGDETYVLKKAEDATGSDYFVVDWDTLASGTYYFKVELNSADEFGNYAFKEVNRENNVYTTSNITVKRGSTIVVNTAEDYPLVGDWESDDKVSLREALKLAELWSIEENTDKTRMIRFDSSVDWDSTPILLNKDCVTDIITRVNETKQVYGTLCVTCNVDLAGEDGSGNNLNITIDGQKEVRIFQIADYHDGEKVAEGQTPVIGLVATIENLTLINGNATVLDGASDTVSAAGGAIASAARGNAGEYGLTLTNVTMTDNVASSGGAVKNVGKMKIENCTITDNKTQYNASQVTYAGDFGGGIYNSGELYITQSTISGNTAGKYGGGIVSYGNSDWETSHISYGKLDIYNTLISGNSAAYGGGICLSPTTDNIPVSMGNVTIVGNVASTQGGGVWYSAKAALSIANSIIYGNICTANSAYNNIYPKSSTPEAVMHNSIYESTPSINFVNFTTGTGWKTWDLRIAASGDANVVDKGDNSYTTGMTADRSGNARINNTIVDLGAYEWYDQYLGISSKTVTAPIGATSVAAGTEVGTLSTRLADGTGVTYVTTSSDFVINGNKLVTKRELLLADSPISVTVTANKADGSQYDKQTWDIKLVSGPLSTPSVASTYQVDGDEVFLTWSDVEGATGFRVRYKLLGENEWTYAADICNGTSGVVRGAFTIGGTYVFQVQAIGGQFSSDSEWSDAQRTLLRSASYASALAGSGVNLDGWSAHQCVTIEYRTPSFETNLSELMDGQMVKLSAKVERSRSISVVGWKIYWGDGASSEYTGRFDSITSTHYYQTEGTYCVSVNVIDSQGAGDNILYYVGSHTFGQPKTNVVQEAALAAVAIEEEIVQSVPDAPVTGFMIPEINVVTANTTKVSIDANVSDNAAKQTKYTAVDPTLGTGSQFTRRNWAINQLVQNLHAVKTDRFFASLPESDELDTGLDYGFETSLEPTQTESVYDEILDEMNI